MNRSRRLVTTRPVATTAGWPAAGRPNNYGGSSTKATTLEARRRVSGSLLIAHVAWPTRPRHSRRGQRPQRYPPGQGWQPRLSEHLDATEQAEVTRVALPRPRPRSREMRERCSRVVPSSGEFRSRTGPARLSSRRLSVRSVTTWPQVAASVGRHRADPDGRRRATRSPRHGERTCGSARERPTLSPAASSRAPSGGRPPRR